MSPFWVHLYGIISKFRIPIDYAGFDLVKLGSTTLTNQRSPTNAHQPTLTNQRSPTNVQRPQGKRYSVFEIQKGVFKKVCHFRYQCPIPGPYPTRGRELAFVA
ncbi:MAG TPA: hypothetical protein VFC92_01930 [Bacteroidales bacterium]|nr:hypothetical protein [Bacteroidales bacterium]